MTDNTGLARIPTGRQNLDLQSLTEFNTKEEVQFRPEPEPEPEPVWSQTQERRRVDDNLSQQKRFTEKSHQQQNINGNKRVLVHYQA